MHCVRGDGLGAGQRTRLERKFVCIRYRYPANRRAQCTGVAACKIQTLSWEYTAAAAFKQLYKSLCIEQHLSGTQASDQTCIQHFWSQYVHY